MTDFSPAYAALDPAYAALDAVKSASDVRETLLASTIAMKDAKIAELQAIVDSIPKPPPPTVGEPDTTGWTWVRNDSTGKVSGNNYVVQGSPRTNAIMKHPTKTLWLHTMRKGDKWAGGGERNELELDRGTAWANDVPVWMAFSYFVRPGAKVSSLWGPCITQCHSNDFSYDAPNMFLVYTADDALRAVTDTPNKVHGTIGTSRGVWHDILIQIAMDPESTKSVFRIWHDKATAPQINSTNYKSGYTTGKTYRKIGPYREPADEDFDIFYTNHEFGADLSYRIGNPAPVIL